MRTIIFANGKKFELRKNYYGKGGFCSSCHYCAFYKNLDGCGKCCCPPEGFDCREFGTDDFGVYAVKL